MAESGGSTECVPRRFGLCQFVWPCESDRRLFLSDARLYNRGCASVDCAGSNASQGEVWRGSDFNTGQVTDMAQPHIFVFEDCHESYFSLNGNLCRMEAHSTCTSERRSRRLFIETSWPFLMHLMIFSAQRWS